MTTELKLGQVIQDGTRRYEVIDAEAANKEVARWKDWGGAGSWLHCLRTTPEHLQLARGFKALDYSREDLEAAGQTAMGLD